MTTYTWGGKYYRQVKGLPIGPRATSAIAKVVMNMFDRKFRLSMDTLRLGMKLYFRYIDDIRSIKLGAKFANGKLEIDQEQKEEDLREKNPEEVATARVIRQIMDCVLPGIEFTSGTSGDFPGEWGVPTLDI